MRLRMEIPKLSENSQVSTPRGTKLWLNGQQLTEVIDVKISGGIDGAWHATITLAVAIEELVQDARE